MRHFRERRRAVVEVVPPRRTARHRALAVVPVARGLFLMIPAPHAVEVQGEVRVEDEGDGVAADRRSHCPVNRLSSRRSQKATAISRRAPALCSRG